MSRYTPGMPGWVQDNCDEECEHLTTERAQGIASIHAPCEPPCPRGLAALEFLDSQRRVSLALVPNGGERSA